MMEFVRQSWRTAAAFAAGAFCLSLLIGLIAGNPFGVVLLRALLLAAVFAALGTGLRLVVRTWLPELAGKQAGASAGASAGGDSTAAPSRADGSTGSRVDITVGGEEGAAQPSYAEAVEPLSAQEMGAEAAEPVGPEADVSPADAAALGELAGELADARPDGTQGDLEEAPPADAVPDMDDLPETLEGEGGPGLRRLDSLPDIAVQEEAVPKPASRSRRPRTAAPDEALKETVGRQDPATLARALRTVLKKDEKG